MTFPLNILRLILLILEYSMAFYGVMRKSISREHNQINNNNRRTIFHNGLMYIILPISFRKPQIITFNKFSGKI